MSPDRSARTYDPVAITLHWLIAFAILYMIWLGYSMTRNEDYTAFQTHKSLGITILALSLLRLAWRFIHPPPPLPAHMPRWEKIGARFSHFLFYALMIGVPLGGWAYVSASPRSDMVKTKIWNLFELPLLPVLPKLPDREHIAHQIGDLHGLFAYSILGLLALHVAAALKHQFWDRDSVLHRMIPFIPSPRARS